MIPSPSSNKPSDGAHHAAVTHDLETNKNTRKSAEPSKSMTRTVQMLQMLIIESSPGACDKRPVCALLRVL